MLAVDNLPELPGGGLGVSGLQLRPMELLPSPSLGRLASARQRDHPPSSPLHAASLFNVSSIRLVERLASDSRVAPGAEQGAPPPRSFQPRLLSGRAARPPPAIHGNGSLRVRRLSTADDAAEPSLGPGGPVEPAAISANVPSHNPERSGAPPRSSLAGDDGGMIIVQRSPLLPRVENAGCGAAPAKRKGGLPRLRSMQPTKQSSRKRGKSARRGKAGRSSDGSNGGADTPAVAKMRSTYATSPAWDEALRSSGDSSTIRHGGRRSEDADSLPAITQAAASPESPSAEGEDAVGAPSGGASGGVGPAVSGVAAPVSRRTSPTGATARVVSHLRAKRPPAGLSKTAPPATLRASRGEFDPDECARRAAARLAAYRRSQAAAAAEAVAAEGAKRAAAAEARRAVYLESEARRLRVYALNAVLTRHEWANIQAVLAAAAAAAAAGADAAHGAEMLAAVATNSV
eukprot:jgi/Tetstr1/454536/TSEL_041433.t1